eukprot:symbB.v1.2.029985.t1/scaffold3334.1/size71796/7
MARIGESRALQDFGIQHATTTLKSFWRVSRHSLEDVVLQHRPASLWALQGMRFALPRFILIRMSIPYEYVRGNLGEHGFGLDKCWSNACSSWLQQRGFGKKISQRSWAGCRLLLPMSTGL